LEQTVSSSRFTQPQFSSWSQESVTSYGAGQYNEPAVKSVGHCLVFGLMKWKAQKRRTAWCCIILSLDTKHIQAESLMLHHTVTRHKTHTSGKPNVASYCH